MGDLNALKDSDYSEEQWGLIERKADANGWAPPRDAMEPKQGCFEEL